MDRYNKQSDVSIKTDNDSPQQHILAESHSLHIGPIPSPEEFAKYKKIMPDFPERILQQFEKDSENIRNLQKQAQEGDISFDKRSQWMAFVIIMTGLVATFILAYFDKNVAAAATGITTAMLVFKGTFAKKNK